MWGVTLGLEGLLQSSGKIIIMFYPKCFINDPTYNLYFIGNRSTVPCINDSPLQSAVVASNYSMHEICFWLTWRFLPSPSCLVIFKPPVRPLILFYPLWVCWMVSYMVSLISYGSSLTSERETSVNCLFACIIVVVMTFTACSVWFTHLTTVWWLGVISLMCLSWIWPV